MKVTDQSAQDAVVDWFEKAVLGLNLCPFAHQPYRSGAIKFAISRATKDKDCLADLHRHIKILQQSPKLETVLLICRQHLMDFSDYNQFLDLADRLLQQMDVVEDYQIASFHPQYRFHGSQAGDRANWTNRSPYPILHILRQPSVSSAIKGYAQDVNTIPEKNVRLIESLSEQRMAEIFGKRYIKAQQKGSIHEHE